MVGIHFPSRRERDTKRHLQGGKDGPYSLSREDYTQVDGVVIIIVKFSSNQNNYIHVQNVDCSICVSSSKLVFNKNVHHKNMFIIN